MYKIMNNAWKVIGSTALSIISIFLFGATLALLVRVFLIGWNLVFNFGGF